jgi:hypothetical protein
MNFHVDVYKIAGGKNLKFQIYNFKFGTFFCILRGFYAKAVWFSNYKL